MAQANVEILRRGTALLNEGNWDALVDPYVICDTRWYGTGGESGVAIDVRQADVCEFREGKVARMTLGYATAAEAIKAVGLEE